MNLMLNGIEAMKDMDIPGGLTIRSQREDNGQLLISVVDTGVGFSVEKMEQIFHCVRIRVLAKAASVAALIVAILIGWD
jgi:nitrogen fixation/metabolism regulation signal transduction histidine kinase